MTKVRAYAVCEDNLYKISQKHSFSDFLLLGKSEKSSSSNKKAILADTVEAVIAAIYLDSGDITTVEKFILDNIKENVEALASWIMDNASSEQYRAFKKVLR